MKCRILILIILVVYLPYFSSGKKLKKLSYANHKEFYLRWDNDMFVFRDYYYTQGAHLFLINPGLRKNPLNHLLPRLKNADLYYGLGIVQEIYTPKDVTDTLLNLIDRPYAGTLYLRSFIASSKPDITFRFTSQLDIGLLGPLAGAELAQRYVHERLGLDWPQGWSFQIDNRPYINYNLLLEKGLISIPGFMDITASSRLRLGTIHDDFQLGGLFRLGILNNQFKGYYLSNKDYAENKDFQWYIFGGARISAVLFDASLSGGLVPPESNNDDNYNAIENYVTEVFSGMELSYRFVGMRGELTWKSAEFETGEDHGWGTVSLYFRF